MEYLRGSVPDGDECDQLMSLISYFDNARRQLQQQRWRYSLCYCGDFRHCSQFWRGTCMTQLWQETIGRIISARAGIVHWAHCSGTTTLQHGVPLKAFNRMQLQPQQLCCRTQRASRPLSMLNAAQPIFTTSTLLIVTEESQLRKHCALLRIPSATSDVITRNF